MAITSPWRVLPVHGKVGRTFLVKYCFFDDSYEIYLTDLSRLWLEKPDYAEVLRKAKENACDIDPSENVQQRRKLFERIADALHGGEGTSLSINSRETDDAVTLDLISPLPAPLSDVHWKVLLHEKPAEVLREHVTGPLLERLHRKEQEIAQLHQMIKEKDHVISRLLDRLESSGTDLTTVFPGTANVKMSRKAAQRTQLSRYVKGLDPFDASSWTSTTTPIGEDHALSAIFKDIDTLDSQSFIRGVGFQDVGTGRTSPSRVAHIKQEVQEKQMPRQHNHAASDTETEDDEDDFQVQHIPKESEQNVVRSQSPIPSSAKLSTVLNHSKDEHLNESRHSLSPLPKDEPASSRSPAKPKARIGTIGGAKSRERSLPLVAEDARFSLSEPQDPGRSSDPPPKKSKLGTIGGRKAKPPGADAKAGSSQPHQQDTSSADGGGCNERGVPSRGRSPQMESDPSADTAHTEIESPKSRETSQERADRRRDELKRQLNTQPQAGAGKKKRKF